MKTNLDSIFKINEVLASKGVWFNINETTGFLVRRFGPDNPQAKAAHAVHIAPYARQIQMKTLDGAKAKEINVKVFVDVSMIDWRGIEMDGEETPYSKEAALKLFLALPELFDKIQDYAMDFVSYKEDVGNSSASM